VTVPVRVGVLDYGSGNLHSVCQALTAAGASVTTYTDARQLVHCDGVVIPGVGAFAACMDGLHASHAPATLVSFLDTGMPVLGICVGHQVLFSTGVEHGVSTPGIDLVPGVVERLQAERLPHIGWNTVEAPAGSLMFAGVEHERFYFVHSYAAHDSAAEGLAWCTHEGDRFVAGVESFNIWGAQFHPEKSGAAGARVLRNWLSAISEGVYR